VNVLCDNALIGGFAAQVRPINVAFVEDVCKDFDIDAPLGSSSADSSLSDPGATRAIAPPERHRLLHAPEVPAAESGEAPTVAPTMPLFGSMARKRRFSFF
jgi:hypothetical protein